MSSKKTVTLVNEIGGIKDQIIELEKAYSKIEEQLLKLMEDGEVVLGTTHKAVKNPPRQNRIIDMDAAKAALGPKRFLQIAKVGVGDLEKAMGKDEIDAVTKGYKESAASLTVKALS